MTLPCTSHTAQKLEGFQSCAAKFGGVPSCITMPGEIHHDSLLRACPLELNAKSTVSVQHTHQWSARWQKHPGVKHFVPVLSAKHFSA